MLAGSVSARWIIGSLMLNICCSTPRCCDFSRGNVSSASGCTEMLPFRSAMRITCESKTPSEPSSGISASLGRFLRKYVDGKQHYVRVKLFHAPPNQTKAAERLVAGQRVARRGLHIFHVAAEDGGKEPGQKLCYRADQVLLMAQHVRWHLRRGRLKESRRERLARASAGRKMRGRLGHLIGERIKIEHLRIGINRRNTVFVRL